MTACFVTWMMRVTESVAAWSYILGSRRTMGEERDSVASIFEAYRDLLFSIAYRMLGSRADAEDMVQETFVRWQQASLEPVRNPRSLLVTIVSRLCINHLQSARVRREQYFGEWLPEPMVTWYPDDPRSTAARVDDSLSMAFLVLLQQLNPSERAVFLLREVFEYEYEEIAAILKLTEANCRQILRRARQHVTGMRPRFDAPMEQREKLLHAFVDAATSGDSGRLVALLSDSVVLHSDGGGKAPALPNPIYGPMNVARAIIGSLNRFVPKDVARRLALVNGQPGVVTWHEGRPFAVFTLDAQQGFIRNIYVITSPDKLAHLERAG